MEKKKFENKAEKTQNLIAKKNFQCTYGNGVFFSVNKGETISGKLPKEILINLKTEKVL